MVRFTDGQTRAAAGRESNPRATEAKDGPSVDGLLENTNFFF